MREEADDLVNPVQRDVEPVGEPLELFVRQIANIAPGSHVTVGRASSLSAFNWRLSSRRLIPIADDDQSNG